MRPVLDHEHRGAKVGVRGGYRGLDVHNLCIKFIGSGPESIHFLPLIQLGSLVLGVKSQIG